MKNYIFLLFAALTLIGFPSCDKDSVDDDMEQEINAQKHALIESKIIGDWVSDPLYDSGVAYAVVLVMRKQDDKNTVAFGIFYYKGGASGLLDEYGVWNLEDDCSSIIIRIQNNSGTRVAKAQYNETYDTITLWEGDTPRELRRSKSSNN